MKKLSISLVLLLFFAWSCNDDDTQPDVTTDGVDLSGEPYDPTPHNPEIPPGFPSMIIPADNPLTEEGIELGRMLFYDPILSVDSTISCASCHNLTSAFTDDLPVSLGVNGLTGRRSSMSLINVAFFDNGLFWDGRSPNLEEQALHPIEDPVEMADIWENVEDKLQRHPDYPYKFRAAFGIGNSKEITRDLVTKAIAQFERILISAESRFDRKFYQNDPDPFLLSDEEVDGLLIFRDEPGTPDAHCTHCHDGPLLTGNDYFNNGLEDVETLNDFPDKGLGEVTGKMSDNGKFRSPSLRNIVLTAPYMHDGRFQTLEEVVDHYNSGGHLAANVQVGSIEPLGLSEDQKASLIAFLHTLTDTSYFNRPEFQNPFE